MQIDSQDMDGRFPVTEVAAVAQVRLEGREPDLQNHIRQYEKSGLGIPIYWQHVDSNGELLSTNPSDEGELIGYALPANPQVTKILVCFDDGRVFSIPQPAKDDTERALFRLAFQPGAAAQSFESTTYAGAIEAFLIETGHDEDHRRFNHRPSDAKAIIKAIDRAFRLARKLRATREIAIKVTNMALAEGWRSLEE